MIASQLTHTTFATAGIDMTVDQYAICPCGNGKKIKFCKCKESLPELERVMTMIEGGQVVPAIDKLNQVLTEHPDAAWALAIKGRLMLDLREYDSLAENSERFVRLQPSNPLALAQRAASELFHNEPQKATLSLLEALTESGRSVDSFVLDIASILAYSLANAGLYLTARAYVQLPLTAQGYEANQTAAMVFQELNTGAGINQLLKTVPPPLPRDEDVAWGERFDEAVGLLRSNQILLAEAKLQSLARTVPREPCVLTGLLTCAIWRGDAQAQADCLRKLSECDQLEMHERSKYLAMSWLVEPDSSTLSVTSLRLDADIANAEEAEMALQAHPRFLAVDNQILSHFREGIEGVPPRTAYQLIDRDRPAASTKPSAEDYPVMQALVLVFGKQTDRSAQIEAVDVRPAVREQVTGALTEALGNLVINESPGRPLSLVESVQPELALIGDADDRRQMPALHRAHMEARFSERLAATPLRCLGDRTLRDVAGDASTLLVRTALVRLLECDESLGDHDDVIMAAVRKLANVDPLPPLHPAGIQEIDEIDAADLPRIDLTNLDTESVLFVFQRARILDSGKLLRRAARRIVELDLTDQRKPVKLLAYSVLVEFAATPEQASDLIEEAKAYATTHKVDQANLRMLELTHCLMNGDQLRFSSTLRSITEQYSNRPEVMARLQQFLMSVGILRPDGTLRERAGIPAVGAPGGGTPSAGPAIWTPGSGAPAAAPAAAASSGSKLWIPGMD
ncbi:MAG: tetratricopeptide repeat protein [Planctomycetaceae bacterium]